jgi:ABC-type Fe3+-hydroxamate transport system substrate-binding protein
MIEVIDQMNQTIRLQTPAKRIVSLVPSQTEFLHAIGCTDELIGLTKFCVHPKEWHQTKIRVGGTKNLNLETIRNLQPDLIIGNKEENSKEDIEILQQQFPVYMSDIYTVSDALKMMEDLGILTGKSSLANQIVNQVRIDFQNLPQFNKKIIYLIWQDPLMAVGPNTFIGEMLRLSGFENVITAANVRYIELSADDLKQLNPEVILLSSEPYPFTPQHCDSFYEKFQIPSSIVDGEMFSWYGSRMLKIKGYLDNLLIH